MKPDGPEPPEALTHAGRDGKDLVGQLVRFRPHYLIPDSPFGMRTVHSLWTFEAHVTRVLPEGVYVRFAWEALDFLGEQLADPDELHTTSCTCRACRGAFSLACAGTDSEAANWRGAKGADRQQDGPAITAVGPEQDKEPDVLEEDLLYRALVDLDIQGVDLNALTVSELHKLLVQAMRGSRPGDIR